MLKNFECSNIVYIFLMAFSKIGDQYKCQILWKKYKSYSSLIEYCFLAVERSLDFHLEFFLTINRFIQVSIFLYITVEMVSFKLSRLIIVMIGNERCDHIIISWQIVKLVWMKLSLRLHQIKMYLKTK